MSCEGRAGRAFSKAKHCFSEFELISGPLALCVSALIKE